MLRTADAGTTTTLAAGQECDCNKCRHNNMLSLTLLFHKEYKV